ncbi:DUF2786 domain-containing protein [Streptomyces sp. NPDC058092]|uniref:DUF2786 domain-containing protein n=1 Tax=Streptomyces sp. NPDC058092 TaxID=3346336 RepID=UPI0036EFD791
MTERGAEHPPGSVFTTARKTWLRTRVTELSNALANHSPELHTLVPTGLGDQRLVNALVISRIAADEARVQPVAETVSWLERLVPKGHSHDLSGAVRTVRSELMMTGDPALRSWNAEAWEELLLALWRHDRTQAVEAGQADDELVSRWGVRTTDAADVHHPERAPEGYGHSLTSLTGFFASEADPLRLLAEGVLSQAHAVDSVEDSLVVYEEALQGAGHLAFLAEQRLRATYMSEWCEKHSSNASEVTEAFLSELSEAVETYVGLVIEPVISSLSECERALLVAAEQPRLRAVDEYLTEFLDCIGALPETVWTDGALDGSLAREAAARTARGESTWHTMRGSVPVWYHVVTSPQERAAALAFSGAPSSSVIRVHADIHGSYPFDLFEGLDAVEGSPSAEDWYPEPGIELRYTRRSATDLCELLALAQLGHARLEFLITDAIGGISPLRSLRAHVRPGDASSWALGAVNALRTLVPNLDDLTDVIAREYETEGGLDDTDDRDSDDDRGFPSDSEGSADGEAPSDRQQESTGSPRANGPGEPESPSPSLSTPLPAQLLARVKAILRQAEDPAATEAEAEAFLQKATALMAKYGIEQALLQGGEPASEQPIDRVVEVTAPWMRECKKLLSWIASQMRCQSVYPGGQANRHRVHLFGFASDLHAVEVLYASLRLQMLRGADRADAEHRPTGEDTRAYKRSWMLGFIRAVTSRIGEAERAAREDTERDRQESAADATAGRSVALVLADRTAVVEAEVASRYPKLGKARPTRYKGSGYRQGHADGEQANIGGLSLDGLDDEMDLVGSKLTV